MSILKKVFKQLTVSAEAFILSLYDIDFTAKCVLLTLSLFITFKMKEKTGESHIKFRSFEKEFLYIFYLFHNRSSLDFCQAYLFTFYPFYIFVEV